MFCSLLIISFLTAPCRMMKCANWVFLRFKMRDTYSFRWREGKRCLHTTSIFYWDFILCKACTFTCTLNPCCECLCYGIEFRSRDTHNMDFPLQTRADGEVVTTRFSGRERKGIRRVNTAQRSCCCTHCQQFCRGSSTFQANKFTCQSFH